MSDIDISDLCDSFRSVLDTECSAQRVHAHIDSDAPFDAALWRQAAELGWLGLTIAEDHGGLGLSAVAACALHVELGRRTAPAPFLTHQLGAAIIAQCGSEPQKAELLSKAAAGEIVFALALPAGSDAQAGLTLDDAGRAAGRIEDVLYGAGATHIIARAAPPQGDERFVVIDVSSAGVDIVRADTVDRTRHLASVSCDGAALGANAVLAGAVDQARAGLSIDAALALGADSLGLADAVFELTLDYLKTREQFGRAIGTFQALKHRCADHKVALEAARALLDDACLSRDAGAPEAALNAALAKAYACDVAADIAEDAVQLHGGIGFTWEHDCHVYLKRAKLNQALAGGASVHFDRAAELLRAS